MMGNKAQGFLEVGAMAKMWGVVVGLSLALLGTVLMAYMGLSGMKSAKIGADVAHHQSVLMEKYAAGVWKKSAGQVAQLGTVQKQIESHTKGLLQGGSFEYGEQSLEISAVSDEALVAEIEGQQALAEGIFAEGGALLNAQDNPTEFDHHRQIFETNLAKYEKAAGKLALALGDGATAKASFMQRLQFGIAVIALLLALGLTKVVLGGWAQSLGALRSAMQEFASGNLKATAEISGQDEVAQLGASFNGAVERVFKTLASMVKSSSELVKSSSSLAEVSEKLHSDAVTSGSEVTDVVDICDRLQSDVALLVSGNEEVVASISEISARAAQAATIAASAAHYAGEANEEIAELGENTQEIDNVLKLIGAVAEQTNLLALNATIEAARAGEAGKGFAVVANEVKELANETAKATDEIAQKIEAIQVKTKEAVGSIGKINEIIGELNDVSSTIAAAVEEQQATTGEVGRSLSIAAGNSEQIHNVMDELRRRMAVSSDGFKENYDSAVEVSRLATHLKEVSGQFS